MVTADTNKEVGDAPSPPLAFMLNRNYEESNIC